jgi:hypothetical protein
MARQRAKSDTQPRFAYTTSPSALRRLLKEIPKRPKPGKLTLEVLKTWQVISTNDATPVGVLKKLGMVGPGGEPLKSYADFMQPPPTGPRALGALIKEHYKELFETSHEPHKDQSELKPFFNIHAGGGERAIDLQIQTFKALSEHADFSGAGALLGNGDSSDPGAGQNGGGSGSAGNLPPVRVDLHIHLPENKTARDYESIIQDIAKYIYGRTIDRG